MSHTNRSSEQQKKFYTLKHAIDGDGDSIDDVVGFPENLFYDAGFTEADPAITTSTTFEELDTADFTIKGGTYQVEILVFFEFSGANASDAIEMQLKLNGQVSGDPVTKTAGAAGDDDDFEYITFNEFPDLPAGTYTISIEGLVVDQAAPGVALHVTRYRVRLVKTRNSGSSATTQGGLG